MCCRHFIRDTFATTLHTQLYIFRTIYVQLVGVKHTIQNASTATAVVMGPVDTNDYSKEL